MLWHDVVALIRVQFGINGACLPRSAEAPTQGYHPRVDLPVINAAPRRREWNKGYSLFFSWPLSTFSCCCRVCHDGSGTISLRTTRRLSPTQGTYSLRHRVLTKNRAPKGPGWDIQGKTEFEIHYNTEVSVEGTHSQTTAVDALYCMSTVS